jgi:putative nucleotidyltransferase with HDIG domain
MKWLRRIQSKHNLIIKVLLAAFTAMLFTFLLPEKQVNFHRVDDFDAVWPYADLLLEQDLFIRKTAKELALENKEQEDGAYPIFKEDTRKKEIIFNSLANYRIKDEEVYSALKRLLDSVYSNGIIESLDMLGSENYIILESEGEGRKVKGSGLFNIQSSYALLNAYISQHANSINELKNVKAEELIAVTLEFDEPKTTHYRQALKNQLSVYSYYLPKGEVLVKRNEVLTKAKRDLINFYFNDLIKKEGIGVVRFIGRFVLLLLLCLTLLVYLYFFRKQIFAQNMQVAFLYLCVLLTFVSVAFFFKYGLMLSAIPYLLVPLLVRVFTDNRTALFTHLISVLSCSLFMPDKYEFIILQMITGIIVLFSVSEMRKRQQVFNAALIAILFYIILFAAYHIGFGSAKQVTKYSAYIPFLISGGLLLLASPFIFIAEKLFGFVSDFKLLELCDLNQPLLRRLSQEVPGTFQHSLQVANLAEEAIYYIGGNTLLIRAGAMYHDVGKLINPGYFIENQGARISPHLEMMPRESARIIIDHVLSGIELAKKHNLPEQIIDFIRTHHGTTMVHFFLSLQKKEQVYGELNEADFRYPGPIPFSKETAVLMLADGVEAASRSLKEHDALSINDLVDRVIDYKIGQNQLINSDITFKDITLIKKIFKKRLMTIYHARIEYPM